ncbi:MAG: helix-hairpin-helix domain-containing protein [Candidatus Zixiibacteriota bacterium]
MNRFFEFSPAQLRVIVFLSALLVVLSAYRFLFSYSRLDENSMRLSVKIAETDTRYSPVIKVDLNLSPADSLELLPGIGPVLARRIVARRDSIPFKKPEDILDVNGIGFSTYEKIKSYIEVRQW